MRAEQTAAAWDCSHKVVRLFHPVLLTESERTEAFRLVYDEVLEAIEGYEQARRKEERRLRPLPSEGG